MVEGLRGLVELSRLDGEIRVRAEERSGLPALRTACLKRRGEVAARLETARARVEALRQEQRRHESTVQDQEALLARLEGQQHQVKSNEAYTALLHEMDAAREAISAAETAILEALEQLDAAHGELGAAEGEGNSELAEVTLEAVGIDSREAELDAQIESLRAERARLASGIDASLVSRYERVLGRRRPAIAIVSGETCTGCRVDIPPQSYLELRNGEALVVCGQCQRILIHQAFLS